MGPGYPVLTGIVTCPDGEGGPTDAERSEAHPPTHTGNSPLVALPAVNGGSPGRGTVNPPLAARRSASGEYPAGRRPGTRP